MSQIIFLHAKAPDKPKSGETCNGCGVCCAAEPCPVARWALRQFRGSCRALVWDGEKVRYFCGLVASPRDYWRWLPVSWAGRAGRFFASRIASGSGCDADVEEVSQDSA